MNGLSRSLKVGKHGVKFGALVAGRFFKVFVYTTCRYALCPNIGLQGGRLQNSSVFPNSTLVLWERLRARTKIRDTHLSIIPESKTQLQRYAIESQGEEGG